MAASLDAKGGAGPRLVETMSGAEREDTLLGNLRA